MDTLSQTQQKLYGIALILAPLLLAISTFFWQDGNITQVAGTIQIYSFIFWIPGLLGLLTLLRPTLPRFSVWGILLVSWVCAAGINFGMEGIYMTSFQEAGADATQLAAVEDAMGMASVFVLFLPGLLFPLTLVLIGFLLWKSRAVPPLFAILLCLGAIGFPISRVPRIELIAHLADLLLLVAAGGMGWLFLQGGIKAQSKPEMVAAGDD